LAQGWAEQDYAAIIKVVEQSAGIHQE
jgi:hypothetical protein